MPTTLKKLTGHIGFGFFICASVQNPACHILWTVHTRVLEFHIWIPHGKIADTCFYFLDQVISLFGVMPLWKNQNEIDACHILWTVHARVLKLDLWIPHRKIAYPYFFSCPSNLHFCSYAPLKKIRMKSCQQDISKSIWARGLKPGQLLKFLKKITLFFSELRHFENLGILNLSAIYLKNHLS